MGFLSELKRRYVIHVAELSLVGAWLLGQGAGTLGSMFDGRAWLPGRMAIAIAVGLFLVVAQLTIKGML